jgi:hypothetical protein
MPAMQSGAMTFLVPAGAATDPVDRSGSATVLADLVLRGAGERDSRALTDTSTAWGSSAPARSGFTTRALAARRWRVG